MGRNLQLLDITKLDRLRMASFCAGRNQSCFLPVVAECAFKRTAIVWILLHHSERAGNDAVSTAVANVRLDENTAEFGTDDSTGRASFKTTGYFAMLANVRGKAPGRHVGIVATEARLRRRFHELHMPPCRVTHGPRIVITEACPVEPVLFDLVPFLAGNFARLA